MYEDMYRCSQYDASDDEYSYVTSLCSDNTNNEKKYNKNLEMKKMDKGFYQVKYWVNKRPMKIELYNSSNSLGYKIRDPITGARLPARIGSVAELDYFKVRMTGLNPENPVTLYYDSPEHFERHQKCELSTDIKEKWWREHRLSESVSQDIGM